MNKQPIALDLGGQNTGALRLHYAQANEQTMEQKRGVVLTLPDGHVQRTSKMGVSRNV